VETCGALEVDVGAADGDLSLEVPEEELPECDVDWWLLPCVVPPTL
jgi:hypothetical protein